MLFAIFLTSISIFISQFNVRAIYPPQFPPNIPITTGDYENWSKDLQVKNLWIATPSTADNVVTLANWAYVNGYKLRALGFMHNWSPLTVTKAASKQNVVLVDTRKHLISMKLANLPNRSIKAVTAQTGASMFQLLTFLEANGLGLYSVPSIGDMTIGGALTIGGHGSGIPTRGEKIVPGHAYGTLSNLIVSFTAIVWNNVSNKFVLKQFDRSDADAKAFLVHLGRTFITEVTLMVGQNYNLRCQSYTSISSEELFASPTKATTKTRTLSKFLDESGRIETILFPLVNKVWLKVWTISPNKPLLSRKVSTPYNYPFSDNIPEPVSDVVSRISTSVRFLNPGIAAVQFLIISAGLPATFSTDIWGSSKNLLLYVKPTTMRMTTSGYVLITKRPNIQKVVSLVIPLYNSLLESYSSIGQFPLVGPVEIRVSLLDQLGVVTHGESPSFSAIRPINNRPELDVAIWINILSVYNAPGLREALGKFESFLYNTFDGTDVVVRPEWSKGWAYTDESAWSNRTVYEKFIPNTFPSGMDGWNWAVSTLDKYDPKRIFTNEFLDKFVKFKTL